MVYEKPQYSMTFDDDQGTVTSFSNADLNALTKKALSSMKPAPTIADMPDTYVKLPAGIISDGKAIQEAEVRELTGEHEEKLAKARAANNPAKYVNTLLQCGTVSVGGKPATSAVLDSLLQGDLDMLMLGIRRATFGEGFELFEVPCEHCGELNDLSLNLSDIPIKTLDNPDIREFVVDIRKGRKAKVQFPTGAVQNLLFKQQISVAEMNSITLAECVISFIDAAGNEIPCNGLSDVKKLGLMDRKLLQEFIYNNQPGPRYDQVIAKCHSCEADINVPLNVGILFREI